MKIQLTPSEVRIAKWIGKSRYDNAIKKGFVPYHQDPNDSLKHDIQGAAAAALCKYLNKFWHMTPDSLGPVDIQPDIQVRSTVHKNGKLFVRPQDKDDHKFVLMIYLGESLFFAAGWLKGIDAKKEEYWWDPRGRGTPDFFVPQDKLNSMDTL